MKKNIGLLDKAIRMSLAAVIAILYYTNVIGGKAAIILGVVALIFVITSFLSTCPLYLPFSISTKKNDK